MTILFIILFALFVKWSAGVIYDEIEQIEQGTSEPQEITPGKIAAGAAGLAAGTIAGLIEKNK